MTSVLVEDEDTTGGGSYRPLLMGDYEHICPEPWQMQTQDDQCAQLLRHYNRKPQAPPVHTAAIDPTRRKRVPVPPCPCCGAGRARTCTRGGVRYCYCCRCKHAWKHAYKP